jgi:hypothetical protein
MEFKNAFIGHKDQPTSKEVEVALGKSAKAWNEFVNWIVKDVSVTEQEWQSVSPKYGWGLRMKKKKRTIVYLGPSLGCFRVAFVLGLRAVEAARASDLPESVVKVINAAPRYAEGTGVRFVVRSPRDLVPLRTLVHIKLAN